MSSHNMHPAHPSRPRHQILTGHEPGVRCAGVGGPRKYGSEVAARVRKPSTDFMPSRFRGAWLQSLDFSELTRQVIFEITKEV